MDNQRRQELYDVTSFLDDAIDRLEEVKNDEQDAFEAMPEGFQNSIRGDNMQEAIDNMENIILHIEEIKEEVSCMVMNKQYKKPE
jgi:signal transduction histidine kinase